MNTSNETKTEIETSESFPALIELNKKALDFTAFAFAGAAVSKDETRHVLMHICIHKGHAIGTDGRRLNRAKLSGAFPYSEEMVLFRVMKLNKSALILSKADAGNFPNYENVLPKLENKLGDFSCTAYSSSNAFCRILNAADGSAFDFRFFEGSAPAGTFEAWQTSNISPLCMISRIGGSIAFQGVVMPLRVN